MSKYYYTKLLSSERRVYAKLLDAIHYHMTEVTVHGVTKKRFMDILTMICRDHPEIFYVEFSHVRMAIGSDCSCTWLIDYLYKPVQIVSFKECIDRRVKTLLRSFLQENPNATPLHKYIWIHDILVKKIAYDYEAVENPESHKEAYHILGVFQHRKAVCQGISLAATLLADELGVDMPAIFGIGKSDCVPGKNDAHSWNLMKLDGKYFHTDITWDMSLSKELKYIRYDYFGLPTNAINRDHEISYEVSHSFETDIDWNMTFFAGKERLFFSYEEGACYIKKAISQGQRTLYFRCASMAETHQQLDKRFTELLQRTFTYSSNSLKSILICHNPEQDIFLFRINTY